MVKAEIKKSTKVGRKASTGRFVTLKDGRKLASPPSGGKFTKVEIRKAVKTATAKSYTGNK